MGLASCERTTEVRLLRGARVLVRVVVLLVGLGRFLVLSPFGVEQAPALLPLCCKLMLSLLSVKWAASTAWRTVE